MPFKIQRVPQGLSNLLSMFTGTPTELEDRVRGALDLLQFYGLQQRQVLGANNAALAEAGSILLSSQHPAVLFNSWAVLFSANANVVKTGTVTALRVGVNVRRAGSIAIPYANGELGPFGATEAGNASLPFVPGYPMLLPPPWDVSAFLGILGTDATANVTIQAEIGILQ